MTFFAVIGIEIDTLSFLRIVSACFFRFSNAVFCARVSSLFDRKDTVMQTPELERKVKDATSNEKWGPTATQMRELAEATYNT
jgi:hypothetical protein